MFPFVAHEQDLTGIAHTCVHVCTHTKQFYCTKVIIMTSNHIMSKFTKWFQ